MSSYLINLFYHKSWKHQQYKQKWGMSLQSCLVDSCILNQTKLCLTKWKHAESQLLQTGLTRQRSPQSLQGQSENKMTALEWKFMPCYLTLHSLLFFSKFLILIYERAYKSEACRNLLRFVHDCVCDMLTRLLWKVLTGGMCVCICLYVRLIKLRVNRKCRWH